MGKLYGISVGPGDPELLTLKACRIINEVDILFCPVKKQDGESFAFEIIKPNLHNIKVQVVKLLYPMHYKEDELKKLWKENGAVISGMLKGERSGAFVTLGDSTIFSTFMYTLPYIDRDQVDIEVIPGITSFCAVASAAALPLVEWEENLTIFPVRKNSAAMLSTAIANSDNLVLMKPASDREALIQALKENELDRKFVLVSKAGTKEERCITNLAELEKAEIPYLSTMIIKKNGFRK